MLKIFAFNTTNAIKSLIVLEELELEYQLIPVNLRAGEQKLASFTEINPCQQIPALWDTKTNTKIFDSAAIAMYLAEKHNKFIPSNIETKAEMLKWFFWQSSNLARASSNLYLSLLYGETDAEKIARYKANLEVLYAVFDKEVKGKKYMAGGEYSILDMVLCAFFNSSKKYFDIDLPKYPNIDSYVSNLVTREKIQKVYTLVDSIDWTKEYNNEQELIDLINK